MNLQDLQLTEQDFDLIVSGLDELPNKGQAGEFMFSIFSGLIAKDDPEAKAKIEAENAKRRIKEEQQKRQMLEEVALLKGKLIMLKRLLVTNGALKQVDDIINPGR